MKFFLLVIAFYLGSAQAVRVASKKFTEAVILAEMIAQIAESQSLDVERKLELGGTQILWSALVSGDIDIYPEYSGTILQEIFSGQISEDSLGYYLHKNSISMLASLGFNNTYAIGLRKETAQKYKLQNISDLQNYPDLRFGFSNEFMDRQDGWPSLQNAYHLPQSAKGIDHDLGYRALESGSIDLIDLYSTDAEIAYYDLAILTDDKQFFPRYDAVILYRSDLDPKLIGALKPLSGKIDEQTIISLNKAVKIDHIPANQVVSDFLLRRFNIQTVVQSETMFDRLESTTIDHLFLFSISLSLAIIVSIPLGLIAFRFKRFGQLILALTGILQTIPSLALLVFMIPIFGIGAVPAIAALFLYSLLPIVRNTHSGLNGISLELNESAAALGLSKAFIRKKIEFPLAMPSILAGIKTSAVINIGTATLGALIGAGGYGQPILTGIRLNDTGLILEGAVPAALLAIIIQYVFEFLERFLVSNGLKN